MASVAATYSSGKYLRASDIQGRGRVVFTIKSVQQKELDGKQRLELSFFEGTKKLTLNASNARTLAELYGDETGGWVSKVVVLVARMVEYGGRQVPGIRIDTTAPHIPAAGSGGAQPQAGQSVVSRIQEVRTQTVSGRQVVVVHLDNGTSMWTYSEELGRAAKARCAQEIPALVRFQSVRNQATGVDSLKLLAIEDAEQVAPVGTGPAEDDIPF